MSVERRPKQILISSGATREPLDGVRFITNFSTGTTGARFAEWFFKHGYEVVFLGAKGSRVPESSNHMQCFEFETFESLHVLMKHQIQSSNFSLILQAAAVGDYSVDAIHDGSDWKAPQLSSKLETSDVLNVRLRRNPKLLNHLKGWGTPNSTREHGPRIVGFKLTQGLNLAEQNAAVQRVFGAGGVDWVIHNDLNEVLSEGTERTFQLFRKGDCVARIQSVDAVAEFLHREVDHDFST